MVVQEPRNSHDAVYGRRPSAPSVTGQLRARGQKRRFASRLVVEDSQRVEVFKRRDDGRSSCRTFASDHGGDLLDAIPAGADKLAQPSGRR
jgi:hypothetical protein